MTKAKSRPTPPHAEKFAEIAAECAKVCGVDVRLTPLAAVPVQVVPAPTDPGTPPAEIACLGVRFDDEYVIVRLPTGGFRAFKVNPEGRVVLWLNVRGGFRAARVACVRCADLGSAQAWGVTLRAAAGAAAD